MMPKQEVSNVTLAELKGGALEELYERALALVLSDIQDANTDAKAKRQIVIKLSFKPSDDRSWTAVDAEVETKLPGPIPVSTSFALKYEQGVLVAHEPIQSKLFADPSAN
jgi:hypothetical protein